MAESIERIQDLLLQAKKESAQAAKELDEIQASMSQVEDIVLKTEAAFPKTDAVLEEIKGNLDQIKQRNQNIANLIGDAKTVREVAIRIQIMGKRLERAVQRVFELDSQFRYPEALKWCDGIEDIALSEDFGERLALQRNALEIAAWNRCSIYVHMAEDNIREGVAPMSNEELDEFESSVNALPTDIHPEEQKRRYLDRIVGYRLMNKARWALAEGNSFEVLEECLSLIKEIRESEESLSDLTKSRLSYLVTVTADIYNYLSVDAFDVRRNYQDAERLFLLRENFEPVSIVHDAYREAVDVKDFHLRFLCAEALAMDDEAFGIAVFAYADSVQEPTEFELEILMNFLLLGSLSDTKKEYLVRAFNRLSFELEIYAFGTTLPKGVDAASQEKILKGICDHKKRELHLELCAKPLLNCKNMLDEPLQKRFGSLLDDILRSPRAHKVCNKSSNVDVHALYGETEETLRRPWGKPMPSDLVKAWDFAAKFCYVAFALILTNAICAAAFGLIFYMMGNSMWTPYVLIAPLALSLVIIHLAVCVRFGRDERGSAVFRRVLAIDGLLMSGASVAYFAMPQTLSMLAPVGYTLIIFAGIQGLWAFFLYKDRNRVAAILTLVPLLLCEIVSLVLLILALMNGQLG